MRVAPYQLWQRDTTVVFLRNGPSLPRSNILEPNTLLSQSALKLDIIKKKKKGKDYGKLVIIQNYDNEAYSHWIPLPEDKRHIYVLLLSHNVDAGASFPSLPLL